LQFVEDAPVVKDAPAPVPAPPEPIQASIAPAAAFQPLKRLVAPFTATGGPGQPPMTPRPQSFKPEDLQFVDTPPPISKETVLDVGKELLKKALPPSIVSEAQGAADFASGLKKGVLRQDPGPEATMEEKAGHLVGRHGPTMAGMAAA